MKKKLLLFVMLFISLANYGQNAVKIGSNPYFIDPSAILDVNSTTKGVLVPRMTDVQRNAIVKPANGLIIFNTVSNRLEVNIGTTTSPNWFVPENIADKSNSFAADGTSTTKYPTVKAVKDYVDGVLITGVPDASTGAKGIVQLAGDLTGTATAPTIATGAITTTKIAANAVDLTTKVTGLLPGANGGTGVNNTGKTITLGGNLTTAGAFATTLTSTGATNVTLPTTGTLATLTGSETLTNKTLTTPVLTASPLITDNSTAVASTAFVNNYFNSTSIKTVTANYTATINDSTILCDATTADFTLTLPAANTCNGKIFTISKIDDIGNILTIVPDIYVSKTITTSQVNINATLRVQSNGTNYYVIN